MPLSLFICWHWAQIFFFFFVSVNKTVKKWTSRTSLVVQWLRLPFPMQEVWVQSLVKELRSNMPHSQKPKTSNRSNIVTNSIKTLKTVHIKKNKKNFEKEKKGASIFVSIYLVILLLHIFYLFISFLLRMNFY